MNCDDIRRLISDEMDGAVSSQQAERVREHLASCPDCRALRQQWERIGRAVQERPADWPDEAYWEDSGARLEARVGSEPGRVTRPAGLHKWGWAAAAVLLVAFCATLYVATDQARRASDADARLKGLAARPQVPPAVVAVPTASREGTATDMKLFHELDITFESGVKWVATDGRKIDFGVSRELGAAPAIAEGPDRVAVVSVAVRRIEGAGRQVADEARIVARTGCRADFSSQTDGLLFSYECLPLIRSDSEARLQLTVGLGKADGDAYGATSATVDLRSGQHAEVGRVVSDGVTYAVEVSVFLLPLQGHGGANGA